MAARNIFLGLLLTVAVTCLEVHSQDKISPCHTDADPVYGGKRVNCQHQKITSLPLPEQWMPPVISTLLLDYNSIDRLNNESFNPVAKYSTLRYLSVSYNQIKHIDSFTFSGLATLQKLDLSSNKINLDRTNLKSSAFQGLGRLVELKLDGNMNSEGEGRYADQLFFDLHNLEVLWLETFKGELNFGGLFNYSRKLSSLFLSGGMGVITNNSFESFEKNKLKNLQILNGHYLYDTEAGAFAYLRYLDSFVLMESHQDLSITMESLAPFVNRNMTLLRLDGLRRNFKIPRILRDNTILTRHMARHLSQICVETVELTQATIFIIENGALVTPTWRRCLKSLDLSDNPLSGEIPEFYSLFTLHDLEYLRIAGRKYAWASSVSKYKLWKPPVCMIDVRHFSKDTDSEDKYHTLMYNVDQNRHFSRDLKNVTHISLQSQAQNKSTKTYDRKNLHQFTPGLIYPVLYLPPKMKIFNLYGESYNMMKLNHACQIQNGLAVEEIYLADNGLKEFIGPINGLPNLRVVDISINDGSTFSDRFFDTMPSIVQLNMAKMNLDTTFMALSSNRLFRVLTNLTTLDLSYNELQFLSSGTFSANDKLSVLELAGNRFQRLPFDINYVPKLCSLDLRKNSFRTISENNMLSLENHVKQVEWFTLHMDGNEFYCGCNSLRFLAWLQRSRINFDMNRNYSCISDTGVRTSTGQLHDLEAMWRKCNGQKAFSLSVILLFLLVLGFVGAIVIPKFKTQLKVFILKTIWKSFLMKTADDYPIGVYIGYADQDINLACQQLRPYIETRLNLSTYIRHRDLLPASDLAESIMEAAHSSWRVLLIVSEHFINDPWSYFLLKASTYSVQTDNPGRLVLILIDDGHQSTSILSRLPSCVLQAVCEESIITMTSSGNISYEDKQSLKTALIYSHSVP